MRTARLLLGTADIMRRCCLALNEVPVLVVSDLSETEKRRLGLADNKIAANAGWDRKLLAAELGELVSLLPECDLTMDFTGFEPAEIDDVLGDLSTRKSFRQTKFYPPKSGPVAKRGDVWIFGLHRLMCGDACSTADIATLMGNERAVMVITDAPYNVKISSI